METKKITKTDMDKACWDGVFNYLVENHQSIWIDGREVQVADVSKFPERDDICLNIKSNYDATEIVQSLIAGEIVEIGFETNCVLYVKEDSTGPNSSRTELVSKFEKGTLFKLENDTLKFNVERISFKPKYK